MGQYQCGWSNLPGPKRWRMGQRQWSESLRAERADRFAGCSGWRIDPVVPGYGARRDGMVARRSVAARIENLTDWFLINAPLQPLGRGVIVVARAVSPVCWLHDSHGRDARAWSLDVLSGSDSSERQRRSETEPKVGAQRLRTASVRAFLASEPVWKIT